MKKRLFVSVSLILILPIVALADIIEIKNPLETEDFEEVVDNLIDFVFQVATPIVPLMIIIAGFLFVTASGNISQIEQSKKILIWTIVGFGILLLSKGILGLIKDLLQVG